MLSEDNPSGKLQFVWIIKRVKHWWKIKCVEIGSNAILLQTHLDCKQLFETKNCNQIDATQGSDFASNHSEA